MKINTSHMIKVGDIVKIILVPWLTSYETEKIIGKVGFVLTNKGINDGVWLVLIDKKKYYVDARNMVKLNK